MRVWYFSEMAYHPAWEQGLKRGSLRVVLPNSNFDPKIGHGLLNRYLDEFALCDEVGLDIMVNEHHSTATCLTVSVPMALAIIARETERARLLSLGTPIANRPDPVRVAEGWRGSTYCRAAGWRWGWSRGRLTRSRRPTATPPI
jgi:alkanesulfonate monooxygenase SsuD/methylene tetrahydromethanopterin reductase-like flavin-dependent oxidoreductase (luciferase family)